jgi:hypothetical protein
MNCDLPTKTKTRNYSLVPHIFFPETFNLKQGQGKDQCCGSGRIRTFLVGSRRPGPDPDLEPDPGLNKWPYINFLGVCKSHKYLRNLFICQEPDPDVFKSRIRILSKIVRIR